MASDHWMQGARRSIERRGTKGVFKEAAERAGMPTGQFARSVTARNRRWEEKHPDEKLPPKMAKRGKQAGLAKAFHA